jgi:hypothetical protein
MYAIDLGGEGLFTASLEIGAEGLIRFSFVMNYQDHDR